MKNAMTAGLATVLTAGVASAADLPRRAAPPPAVVAPPVFTWTGIYFGTQRSYLFSDRQPITSFGNDPTTQGLFALGAVPALASTKVEKLPRLGGNFGINYQLTPGSGFVVGGSFSIDWTDASKTVAISGAPLPPGLGGVPLTSVFNQRLDFLSTVNARLGYAFDNLLVYGTGGLAIGKERFSAGVYLPGGVLVASGGDGGISTGYNYGGGIEYALPKGGLSLLRLAGIDLGGTTTIKAEYIRYDLGEKNVLVEAFAGPGTSGTSRFATEGSIIRAGLNYKFP